jgi:thioredoxin reductase (NADPH)
MQKTQVLIVGAGIAGISAALWCQRLGLKALVLEQKPDIGGQLIQIKNKICDFPPHIYDDGTALLADLQQYVRQAQLSLHFSESLIHLDRQKRLIRTANATYQANYLILATGVRPKTLPCLIDSPLALPPTFSSTTQRFDLQGLRVAIIGGGDRALESAYNLSTSAQHLWLIVRGDRCRGRTEWVERLKSCPNVTLWLETAVQDAIASSERRGLLLQRRDTAEPFFLACDRVLPRIGIEGNSDFVPFLGRYGENFLITDEYQRTTVDWIYAIGDLTNGNAYSSLALALGQGMKAAKHIALHWEKT